MNIPSPKNQMTERELIIYLKQTIDALCDRVRNKMVAPYTVITMSSHFLPSNKLVEVSKADINWLCHYYLPSIQAQVSTHIRYYVNKNDGTR